MRLVRLIAVLLAGATAAGAAEIERVPYARLEGGLAARVDFEGFPGRLSPGTPLEGVQELDGVAFGERFAGQALHDEGGFDRIEGAPAAPLGLEAGAAGQNLSVSRILFLSRVLLGLGGAGWPETGAGGEGAVAVLFARDQRGLGFRVAADPDPAETGTPPSMRLRFFRRDASEIAALEVPLTPGWAAYGFARAGMVEDIAGFTLTNDDPEGIAIDDLIFDLVTTLAALR